MVKRSGVLAAVAATALLLALWAASPCYSEAPPTVSREGESYRLSLRLDSRGNSGVVHVDLAAKEGFKINKDFPNKIKTNGSTGVTLPKDVYGNAEARTLTEARLVFELPYTLTATEGQAAVRVAFRFGVCKLNSAGETVSCQFFTEEHDLPLRP